MPSCIHLLAFCQFSPAGMMAFDTTSPDCSKCNQYVMQAKTHSLSEDFFFLEFVV